MRRKYTSVHRNGQGRKHAALLSCWRNASSGAELFDHCQSSLRGLNKTPGGGRRRSPMAPLYIFIRVLLAQRLMRCICTHRDLFYVPTVGFFLVTFFFLNADIYFEGEKHVIL